MAEGKAYDVDQDAIGRGDAYYASLLGIPIRGLDFANGSTEYDFWLETSYFDFDCDLVGTRLSLSNYSRHIPGGELNLTQVFDQNNQTNFNTFAANITGPGSWGSWEDFDETPSLHLLYASLQPTLPIDPFVSDPYALFNCSMRAVVVQTEMRCGPRPSSTSCSARRQRRIRNQAAASRLLRSMTTKPSVLNNILTFWQKAAGSVASDRASPTDNYLAGDSFPFAGQLWRSWEDADIPTFSRRLTAAFNTFWFATLDPFTHTNVSFDGHLGQNEIPTQLPGRQVFLNSTEAVVTTTYKVYKANRFWVTVVLATTFILEILAIIGLGLRLFIHGPDVLGYVSSMTRENPHVPLPSGGSGLNGPDRAKILREVWVELADVRPGEDVGYVAFRAIPMPGTTGYQTKGNEIRLAGQLFARKRLYL